MFTIQEKLEPIVREYNRFLEGHYLASLLQFKGQAGVGNEYVSKVFRAQSHQKYSKYTHAKESVRNPTYAGFLQDNWVRLVAFNGRICLKLSCREVDCRIPSCSQYEQSRPPQQSQLPFHRDHERRRFPRHSARGLSQHNPIFLSPLAQHRPRQQKRRRPRVLHDNLLHP